MKVVVPHGWNVSPREAMSIQERLRHKVVTVNVLGPVRTVAGVDIGFRHNLARAAVVVLSYPDLAMEERATAELPVQFPYVPGLLAFREAPATLAAFEKLAVIPDLVIFDGQGLAHPRRLGIASHEGVLLDLPSIGCAKSRLCGEHQEPGNEPGAWSWLYDQGEVIGAVVRSKADADPLFVSIGHKVDLPTAIHYVLSCCRNNRLPETTRLAHLAAGEAHGMDQPRQRSLFEL
ncbi:MAG: deoxyribonuclease V [Chloroflexi bacterium]|nr:deoxyribonuclease V [Chloroflexota bacterium]